MSCPTCGSSRIVRIYSAECVLREMPGDDGAAPTRQVAQVLHATGPVRFLCQACGDGWWETSPQLSTTGTQR